MLRLKDESIFEDAEAFKPERWLRNKDTALIEAVEAFASLPFGLRLRMCPGRRIAELELHLLMGRIVQQFDISYPPEAENVKLFIRGVTISDRPIKKCSLFVSIKELTLLQLKEVVEHEL